MLPVTRLLLFLLTTGAVPQIRCQKTAFRNKRTVTENTREESSAQMFIRSDDTNPLEAVVSQLSQTVSTLSAKLEAAENTILTLKHVSHAQGSVFIRWGRSVCPSGTTTIYSGVAGGSRHTLTGGGANRLCLTKEPVFDGTPTESAYGELSGMEYYIHGHHFTDVVCAVCRAPYVATYMVPGTNRCPNGSVAQYQGHLSAGYIEHAASSEYLCLDAEPEDRLGSGRDEYSGYFEHVKTHCGALPCPPYVNGTVVTCVVCSTN